MFTLDTVRINKTITNTFTVNHHVIKRIDIPSGNEMRYVVFFNSLVMYDGNDLNKANTKMLNAFMTVGRKINAPILKLVEG